MKTLILLTTLLMGSLVVGCSGGEQTTEADLKAATAGQVPDPKAAEVSSPMAGAKGGKKGGL